jgi:hypothetical protein
MGKIIITDLTRFQNPEIVCTAGTDIQTGACIRPMPYLRTTECVRLKLLPGAILSGEFLPEKNLQGPHQEDTAYSKLAFIGPSSSKDFKKALNAGLQQSVESGFEIRLHAGQKHVPLGHALLRSIISLRVDPGSIEIAEDKYGKIKVHFCDGSGREFRYLPITDLGLHRYSEARRASNKLAELTAFIRGQPQAYLRLGLSRAWNNGSINGYWMQVNGVYTFPDFFTEIRSYK